MHFFGRILRVFDAGIAVIGDALIAEDETESAAGVRDLFKHSCTLDVDGRHTGLVCGTAGNVDLDSTAGSK